MLPPLDPSALAPGSENFSPDLSGGAVASSNAILTPTGGVVDLPGSPLHAVTDQLSDVVRETPELSKAREALVKQWADKVKNGKTKWEKVFRSMRENMKFLGGDQWNGGDEYVANITQRHIQQRVAALYAKNPRIVCKRRQTLDFAMWDGSFQNLQTAQATMAAMQADPMMAVNNPMAPMLQQFMQDVAQGSQKRTMLDKVSKTLEILFKWSLDSQLPPFKLNMKQLVRRTLACKVGYAKVGFQRLLEKRPEDVEKVNTLTEQVAAMERIMADATDEKLDGAGGSGADSPELENLRLLLRDAEQNMQEMVSYEGLTFDFPPSTSIIIDPCCRHLRTFTGASWVAQEFTLTKEAVQEIYGIDLKSASQSGGLYGANLTGIPATTASSSDKPEREKDGIAVWEIWDKSSGQVLTIADGYQDFLREPAPPDVWTERFWPFFPLCFNELEADGTDENTIFPISDVELLMPMQREYNRCREGLRRHRIANRARHVSGPGALSDTDKANLASSNQNDVIELQTLQPGADVKTLLQPVPNVPIDAALYDTNMIFEDVLRTVGTQEANLGGTSAATATESSIAESSRMSSLASNVDDLDDMLNEMAKAGGQILLMQMSPERVKEIVGPGAVWPESTRKEVADELMLEIEAGSSGRPNKAAEIANFERLAPILQQTPGVNPEWFLRQAITRLDDRIDPTDCFIAGLPSMMAMAAISKGGAMGPGGGGGNPADPANDPAAQGAAGAQNAPQAPGSQSGGPPQSPQLPVMG